MAILKYRNNDGTFTAIPAMQGPVGPRGFKGDKGDKGDAGGIQDVSASSEAGYITVTKADGSTKNVSVGTALSIAPNTSASRSYVLTSTGSTDMALKYHTGVYVNCQTGILYGAVWNDYAEYRETENTEAGRAVYEKGDDTLGVTYERMLPMCSIVSDTYGFAIGETDKCQTPLAMAGRVLAYPYEDRDSYKPGDAVCSGPNGTVSKMTQEEKVNHPECIIGYVSCVPAYDVWGPQEIAVNNRIWIKIV
jgi:hypothetical protein